MALSAKPPAVTVRRRGGGDTVTVSVHVRNLAQMFNLLDPSPFWDRDLDREAARFIEEEFSDMRAAGRWHLRVHASEGEALAADLRSAVARYYQRLAGSARHRQRERTRLGQLSLLGGTVIFLLSMSARAILVRLFPHGGPPLIGEGLIILAWLALWRPAESLVYGWVPLFRERRLYERLAAMRVSVRIDVSAPGPAQASPPGGASAGGHAAAQQQQQQQQTQTQQQTHPV